MARPLRIEYPHAFYHVIQRGIERRSIFISDRDKEKFLSYLESAHRIYAALIHTYVLMNNHYHFILETPRANLSKIMHYLGTSYAIYFNIKRKRPGPLYQGRYKAVLVEEDEYLHHLSRYIHLNPVRAKIVKDPMEYRWSSYNYFITNKKPPNWLNTDFILSMFNNGKKGAKRLYKEFVLKGIDQGKDIIERNMKMGIVLGSEEFLENIIKCFLKKKSDPEIPDLRKLGYRKEIPLEYIENIVENMNLSDKRLKRAVSIYLSRKYTEKSLWEIAKFYGNIKDTGISQVFKRMQARKGRDKTVGILLITLEKLLDV